VSLAAWLGFLLAAIIIAVTPGPGAVLSMSTGARHGYGTALVAILGLQAALLVHLIIVAVGFGSLLAASETAFLLVRFIGAAYLVWLGVGALVPQFVNPGQPVIAQYLLITASLCFIDLTVMSIYALAAVRMGRWLHNPKAIQMQNRMFGGLFFSAGVLLATSSRS